MKITMGKFSGNAWIKGRCFGQICLFLCLRIVEVSSAHAAYQFREADEIGCEGSAESVKAIVFGASFPLDKPAANQLPWLVAHWPSAWLLLLISRTNSLLALFHLLYRFGQCFQQLNEFIGLARSTNKRGNAWSVLLVNCCAWKMELLLRINTSALSTTRSAASTAVWTNGKQSRLSAVTAWPGGGFAVRTMSLHLCRLDANSLKL